MCIDSWANPKTISTHTHTHTHKQEFVLGLALCVYVGGGERVKGKRFYLSGELLNIKLCLAYIIAFLPSQVSIEIESKLH